MNGLDDRFYRMAWRKSFESNYHQPFKRMAAYVVCGGQVASFATNMVDKHCERRALMPHHDYGGGTIYVARSNGLISRPCVKCMSLILAAGIRKAVYINAHGNLTVERIS